MQNFKKGLDLNMGVKIKLASDLEKGVLEIERRRKNWKGMSKLERMSKPVKGVKNTLKKASNLDRSSLLSKLQKSKIST